MNIDINYQTARIDYSIANIFTNSKNSESQKQGKNRNLQEPCTVQSQQKRHQKYVNVFTIDFGYIINLMFLFLSLNRYSPARRLTIRYLKSTMETEEQCVKYVGS